MAATGRTVDAVSTWWAYVQRHANGETHAKIGERVGVTGPSVGRWAKGSIPDPAQVSEFARRYGRPVLEAFLAAGFLTADEAGQQPAAPPSLTGLSNEELLEEVASRMREGGTDAGTAEAGKKIGDVATGRQVIEKDSAPRS